MAVECNVHTALCYSIWNYSCQIKFNSKCVLVEFSKHSCDEHLIQLHFTLDKSWTLYKLFLQILTAAIRSSLLTVMHLSRFLFNFSTLSFIKGKTCKNRTVISSWLPGGNACKMTQPFAFETLTQLFVQIAHFFVFITQKNIFNVAYIIARPYHINQNFFCLPC